MDFDQYIGQQTASGTVVVERAPISQFAKAVTDDSPVYRNADAAAEAGFESIPAPPTYAFVAPNWGRWEELQAPQEPGGPNPMYEVMGQLMATGGLVLHGEQEFRYHRPMVVGDVLTYRGVVKDIYQRASGDRTMTFLVVEDTFVDEAGEPVVTATMNLIHRS